MNDERHAPRARRAVLAIGIPRRAAVADCAAALEAKGVSLVSPLTDHPFGHRTIFFRDPDGNVLVLHNRYAPNS